jgi:hypothetical protein
MREHYRHKNITQAETNILSDDPCNLGYITVNKTSAGAITIYDSATASGKKIATLKASIAEGTYTFKVKCYNGLTIVTAGASDITVAYR